MQSNRPKLPWNDRDDDGGMVISSDNRSLQRGRRRARRTEVCRPCIVWRPESPEEPIEGVVLDLNPRGMRIRMLQSFPEGALLKAQLMRDENFQVPLSQPLNIRVVRVSKTKDGFVDHGARLEVARIKRAETVRPVRVARPNVELSKANRMFTALLRNQRGTGK
ncbi:MAG: hypothetical protein KF886_06880 [Candidatus Hydrogenedentes bacterium]|nr:hypothetical protein [Candidatus Hydrogenedentota bacterium]